jgi:hypothetical protein
MEHDDPLRRGESTAAAHVASPVPDVNVAPARGDTWFRAAALAGAATLPLVLIASTLSDVSGSGGLDPESSDAQLVEVVQRVQGRVRGFVRALRGGGRGYVGVAGTAMGAPTCCFRGDGSCGGWRGCRCRRDLGGMSQLVSGRCCCR